MFVVGHLKKSWKTKTINPTDNLILKKSLLHQDIWVDLTKQIFGSLCSNTFATCSWGKLQKGFSFLGANRLF